MNYCNKDAGYRSSINTLKVKFSSMIGHENILIGYVLTFYIR